MYIYITYDQVKLSSCRSNETVMNEFQCYKNVPFVDLWLYFRLL